jgi:alpha-galactosidase
MPGSAALTRDPGGRVEPTRLGVRFAEATAASRSVAQHAGFTLDPVRLGPFELVAELEVLADAARVRLRARNLADEEARLDAVVLGLRWTGHGHSSLRFLRHGWQSWSQTSARDLDALGEPEFPSGPWLRGLHHSLSERPPDRGGWHESDLVSVAGPSRGGPVCLAGAYESGRSFAIVYLKRDGQVLHIDVEQRVDAVLPPGAARALEPVRVALGDDASELLEDYALAHGREAGARGWRPFLSGWCSWYHAFHAVTEQDVLRNLEALVAAREEIPVDVVQLDDGYQRAVGDWLVTNEKFPRGLPPLAAEIRDAGFIAGLWTAPFCVAPESELFGKHRDWVLQGADGPLRGLVHPEWSADGSVYVLDASRREVLAHLERVHRELADMGFAYQKLDFLYTSALEAHSSDPRIGRAERLRRGLDAVRAGAGGETFLLGCGCPLGAAVGVVDGMRVGPDVAPTWRHDPAASIPGIEDTLPSARGAVRNTLARSWMHRRLWLNDPDCLLARSDDTQLTRDERRLLATTIAATGGMAFFSDDLPRLSADDRALLRATLAHAHAVDGSGIPGAARVLEPLADGGAGRVVAPDAEGAFLALVNTGDSVARTTLEGVGLHGLAAPPQERIGCLPSKAGPSERSMPAHAGVLLRAQRGFSLAVFCDFDGTFSVQDVGATLAQRHAPERRPAMWARYVRGEITAWEYNLDVLDGFELPLRTLEAFLHSVDLDPGARALVSWCQERAVPFRVLSDGFDWNLNRLQAIHGVRFAHTANHLHYERGRWRIRAGAPDADCGCGTGVCKGGILQRFRQANPGIPLVHVGNGRVSDTCGALAADLVFAKDSLALELAERGVSFESFETLHDVIPVLEGLLAGRLAPASGPAASR